MFRVPCPGCGLTRSFRAIWRGEGIYAFRCHLLGPPLFVLFCSVILVSVLSIVLRGKTADADRLTAAILNKRTALSVFGLFVVVWFVRIALLFSFQHGIHNAYTSWFIIT
jgi:hypothetical protein